MVYHSSFNDDTTARVIGNFSLLPLKTKHKGTAPPWTKGPTDKDIVDEAIEYYRANILFRNFEVKGSADRVLIYLTLFISHFLNKIANRSKGEAEKVAYGLTVENFPIPGDGGFPLGGIVCAPDNRNDADCLKQYMTQLRHECGYRLCEQVYLPGKELTPNKWWVCYNKRKFLGKTL